MSFRWGIYEKALPAGRDWRDLLAGAAAAGYQFLEISIDETEERIARLEWTKEERKKLHLALAASEVTIDSMCLSTHRKYSLGSASRPVRERGMTLMKQAIEFAAEFGLRLVQVAGYDVFYEESTETSRSLFLENLIRSAAWARESCIMLGLENVDSPVVDSITSALRYVEAANTPWFQLYPDIANLAAMGKDVSRELLIGGSHIVSLHLKDGRIGEIRRVPFGQGIVDFDGVFVALKSIGYRGPFVVEMWNENGDEAIPAAAQARQWLMDRFAGGKKHDRTREVR
jgi:L-ribulose-5-phosphate 3-epimerase